MGAIMKHDLIKTLAEQAGFNLVDIRDQFDYGKDSPIVKFADLLVQHFAEVYRHSPENFLENIENM